MYIVLAIFFLFCFDFSRSYKDDYTCVQNSFCSCMKSDGEFINLLPLVLAQPNSQPLIASTKSFMFIYHPCFDASLSIHSKNECQYNYGICYFEPNNTTDEVLDFNKVISNKTFGSFTKYALNGEAVFTVNELHQVEIIYKHTVNDLITLSTTVQLHCDKNIKNYTLVAKKNKYEVLLILSSHYLCLNDSDHISKTAVFFLILVILIALYFVGGMLVLKFLRGATGIEMIPNHEFWCRLVERIKNGFMYLFSFGKRTPDSYEKI